MNIYEINGKGRIAMVAANDVQAALECFCDEMQEVMETTCDYHDFNYIRLVASEKQQRWNGDGCCHHLIVDCNDIKQGGKK